MVRRLVWNLALALIALAGVWIWLEDLGGARTLVTQLLTDRLVSSISGDS